MLIGQHVLLKYNGRICEGVIEEIYKEELRIKINDETYVIRKFWEIRKIESAQ